MPAKIVQWETRVSAKCDNLQRLCFLPGASNRTGTQWHENPLHERIQPIGKKQALPYVLERSTIVSKGVQSFSPPPIDCLTGVIR